MKTQKELAKDFSVAYNDQIHIIESTFFVAHKTAKEITTIAQLFKEQMLAIYNQYPDKKFNTLVDTTQITQDMQPIPKEARKIYLELIDHPQTNKIAMATGPSTFSFISKFILGLFARNNLIKFFANRIEALAWLNHKS